jgi:Uma2 family endonuclease
MATATETPTILPEGEHRIVLRGVGWRGYQSLRKIVGDRPVRLTYDRGDVELMSPQPRHERKKSLLGQFVRILARELRLPVMPMGSTTFNSRDLDRGIEADESFYLGDLERIRDADHIDLEIDPPPDLAIEIEITRSALDRMGIYSALRVPEIWRFNGRTLRVMLRQDDGSYRQSPTSAAFPDVPVSQLARFATREGSRDENAVVDEFVAWVREVIVPRARGDRGGE